MHAVFLTFHSLIFETIILIRQLTNEGKDCFESRGETIQKFFLSLNLRYIKCSFTSKGKCGKGQ